MPTAIDILGITYTIKYVDDQFQTSTCHFGEVDNKKCEIKIANDQTDEQKKATLIHEVLHALHFMLGYEETIYNEQYITAMATALYQMMELK